MPSLAWYTKLFSQDLMKKERFYPAEPQTPRKGQFISLKLRAGKDAGFLQLSLNQRVSIGLMKKLSLLEKWTWNSPSRCGSVKDLSLNFSWAILWESSGSCSQNWRGVLSKSRKVPDLSFGSSWRKVNSRFSMGPLSSKAALVLCWKGLPDLSFSRVQSFCSLSSLPLWPYNGRLHKSRKFQAICSVERLFVPKYHVADYSKHKLQAWSNHRCVTSHFWFPKMTASGMLLQLVVAPA